MTMMPGPEGDARARMGMMLDDKQDPAAVGLREFGEGDEGPCQACVHFAPPNQCDIVAGSVRPSQTCDAFSSGEQEAAPEAAALPTQ